MLHVSTDVVARNLFNRPLGGTPEIVANWWMPTAIFLAIPLTQRLREHLDVTFVLSQAGPRSKMIGEIFQQVVLLIVAGAMTNFAFTSAATGWAIDQAVVADIRLIIWPAKIVMALGLLLWVSQILVDLIGSLLTNLTDKISGFDAHVRSAE